MPEPSSVPTYVLIVADPPRISGLLAALTSSPLGAGNIEVLASSGGDDTIDLFEERRPPVVVVTATLETGDSKSLIEALRSMVPRSAVEIVLVGDEAGPIRTALDAGDLAPVRFVTSPVADKALRAAVTSGLDAVMLARGSQPIANGTPGPVDDEPTNGQRHAQRARWEALADAFDDNIDEERELGSEAEALPPPILIRPRRHTDPPRDAEVAPPQAWRPGTTAELQEREPNHRWSPPEPPSREPTLIIRDPEPTTPPPMPADAPEPQRVADPDLWSSALPLASLGDRSKTASSTTPSITYDELDEAMILVEEIADAPPRKPPPPPAPPPAPMAPSADAHPLDGRDFARQLRAKMSMMAQRLFQGGDAAAQPAVDLGPRHDHHTEIDLASLGEEPALDRGVTEIEARAVLRHDVRDLTTSPGSWDTQIRERGLPDSGEIVRGLSDAAMLLAKMFAQASTGRVGFRQGDVERVVFFDQGRPVFASSSEPRDRMGAMLVREGKITASQFERCQVVAVESGRRMGEILVDFGYLKRRELLPAVRRHVEDIVYSLFAMDRGTYHIAIDATPCAERIRLSRHPAALILEGIRRKLDRSSLDRLIGSPSTVIEVPDRERLGGIINLGDLAVEERGALAAFDGQADLATIARVAGVDVADVLPLAWGLCVLGLATARRTDTEVPDESSALVGETDLAIDRERVRARWELVSEADYFALLGVRRDATAFEIRRAYQSARRDFAADGFPTDLRRELAQELDDIAVVLDEAFRILRDDRLRVTYLANLID
ncbi:MAG: response regulator receiver protein [Myxococcales bacterium]|nr:response regulator receiver protein [Myxococcales bacterium]